MTLEYITHAAVKDKEGTIYLGARHADCIRQITDQDKLFCQKADSQGFLTSHNRFVKRQEAATIACKAKQLSRIVGLLFSEDMLSEQDGGLHYYDPAVGYVRKEER